MSDKKSNLNDFFKKENTKKKTTKPAGTAGVTQVTPSEDNTTQVQETIKPVSNAPKVQKKTDYESSEEGETDIITGEETAVLIKDKKDVDAAKRKQQQEEQGSETSGWKALENQSKDKAAYTTSTNITRGGPLGAQPKGPAQDAPKGDIKFGGKKPTFTKQAKGGEKKKIMEDFPEFGETPSTVQTKEQAPDQNQSKMNSANIGNFGTGGVERRQLREGEEPAQRREYQKDFKKEGDYQNSNNFKREERKPEAPVEEKKDVQKPVFTSSKKKVLQGGDQVDVIQSSKQNYDFSSLKTSAATNKVAKPKDFEEADGNEERKDGEYKPPRTRKEFGGNDTKSRAIDDDSDFVTVTDKKREIKPKATGEASFGFVNSGAGKRNKD